MNTNRHFGSKSLSAARQQDKNRKQRDKDRTRAAPRQKKKTINGGETLRLTASLKTLGKTRMSGMNEKHGDRKEIKRFEVDENRMSGMNIVQCDDDDDESKEYWL